MRKIEFTHERTNTHYVRVNRRVALKAFKDNFTLVVYGENENPNSPWNNLHIWLYCEGYDYIKEGDVVPVDKLKEYHFVRLENTFQYYNNKKPWWFLPENIANHYTNK